MTQPKFGAPPRARSKDVIACYCARFDLVITRSEASVRPTKCPAFKLDQKYWMDFAFDAAVGHFVRNMVKDKSRYYHSPHPTCIHCFNAKPAPYWLVKQYRDASRLSAPPRPPTDP